jgi:hypothetical protein
VAKKIKVIYRKLGKHNVHGFADKKGKIIEIDERLKGKKLLEILIHEAYHVINPKDSEEEVERKSAILTRLLWDQGFRKVDNHDLDRLQDGRK